MSYKQVGTSRNWAIWQKNGQPDFVGNMKLELSVSKADPTATPDLVEEALREQIGEHMLDHLEEFESQIKLGSSPTPAPSGLTTAQKTYCRGRVTYMKGHLDKLEASAVKAPTVLAESQKVRTGLATLDTAIVNDPITMPSGRPLGLARYTRRR